MLRSFYDIIFASVLFFGNQYKFRATKMFFKHMKSRICNCGHRRSVYIRFHKTFIKNVFII